MFRDNEIDAEVLPDLTESDLGQLGMPLGHRKRLLKGDRALSASSQSPPEAGVVAAREARQFRRAASIDGDVLRSRRLDALWPLGSIQKT